MIILRLQRYKFYSVYKHVVDKFWNFYPLRKLKLDIDALAAISFLKLANVFLIHAGASCRSLCQVFSSGFSSISFLIMPRCSFVRFSFPIAFMASTKTGTSSPLYSKFFGTLRRSLIVLFPNLISRAEPLVIYSMFIGTCSESPSWFMAVLPVGRILALSRTAMALTISFTGRTKNLTSTFSKENSCYSYFLILSQ